MITLIRYLGFMGIFNCLVGCFSMTVWTPAVLSVLYACVLYFCIQHVSLSLLLLLTLPCRSTVCWNEVMLIYSFFKACKNNTRQRCGSNLLIHLSFDH